MHAAAIRVFVRHDLQQRFAGNTVGIAWALILPLLQLALFALVFAAERRPALHAAAFSAGVVALAYLLFGVMLKLPLERGILGF